MWPEEVSVIKKLKILFCEHDNSGLKGEEMLGEGEKTFYKKDLQKTNQK